MMMEPGASFGAVFVAFGSGAELSAEGAGRFVPPEGPVLSVGLLAVPARELRGAVAAGALFVAGFMYPARAEALAPGCDGRA